MTEDANTAEIDPAALEKAQGLYKQTESFIAAQDYESAVTTLEEAIDTLETPDGYYWLGVLYKNFQRIDDAIKAFENCVRMNDAYFTAHAELGTLKMDKAQFVPALKHYRRAYETAPEKTLYAVQMTGFLERVRSWKFQPEIKELVAFCLAEEGIDSTMLGRSWLSIFKTDPALKSVKKLLGAKNDKAFAKRLAAIKDKSVFNDPFWLAGLQNLTIADYEFEMMLTRLRRILLLHGCDGFDVAFLQALAVYCCTTEYIFYVSDEERERLDVIAQRHALADKELCVFACYGFLLEPQYAAQMQGSEDLSLLRKYHVDLSQQLAEMCEKIPMLTEIESGVSEEVRDQYEAFPYPRWEYYTPALKDQTENFLREGKPEILVAGCGTGLEAVELATALPDAKILAVDLSLASLAYAASKAKEHGIRNIAFQQADILKLGELHRKFDFIVSSGVLHHLDDPAKGLAVLTGLLKPEGVMRLALYSRTARHAVIKTQQLIKDKGYGNDAVSIRRFRHDAPDLLKSKDLKNLQNFRDYFLMSECRDLLFHVQEHCYDIPELEKMLQQNDLDFLHFYQEQNVLQKYLATYMDDPEAVSLENWHEFEQNNPDIFAGMYRFWVRRKA